ncbi:MAG TPA: bifunctional phosphoglucose/phosphomannose isomerase [Solirubrobacterales bacterium]
MNVVERIQAVDPSGQLDAVRALPEHLRDALWRFDAADLDPVDCRGLVVCGMGGSAIGGDLARAAFGDRQTLPMETVRGYAPSSATPADHAVFCSSYSGTTEETVACYAAAEALGATRITATTGGILAEAARADGVPVIGLPAGLQPRAAVGYGFGVAAEVAAHCGVAPSIRTEIDAAASHLESRLEALTERAGELAAAIEGSVPLIGGCGLTAPVAYRWKCQFNENSKWPAFSHSMPELDHNEIVGWQGAGTGGAGEFSAIFLEDRDHHPRVRQRFELTAELISPQAQAVHRIETEGESRTERLLWAVMLGDLTSLSLAGLRGVDPEPVAVIERLKDRLGRP